MIFIPNLDQLDVSSAEWERLCALATAREVTNEELIGVQSKAALLERWDVVYTLSLLAGLETSVLIDAEDTVSVDWGSPGRVALAPPVGCVAPFKVWTLTHPGFEAYWSGTDTRSLAIAGTIVSRALVLGSPGIKQALNESFNTIEQTSLRIMPSGPLHLWTAEPVLPWEAYYERLHSTTMQEMNV